MIRARPLLVALLAGAVAALTGCGGEVYRGEAPGALHGALISEMKGFDPTQSGDETTTICVLNLYDQLYEFEHLARPFALKPCLAAAMPEVSEDGLVYTIRLKPGVRFADDPCFVATGGRGRELTASDVVFSFLRLMDVRSDAKGSWVFEGRLVGLDAFHDASGKVAKNPRRAAYTVAEGYPEVEGLRAIDPLTLQLRLTAPYPQLVWVLAMPYGSVYPPEAVAYYGVEFMNHPVTTGPYRVVEYSPAQRVVFERNPTYREETFPPGGTDDDRARRRLDDVGKRLPLNDRVVLTVFKESQPMWLYFKRGFLDRVGIPKDNFDSAVDGTTGDVRAEFAERGIRLDKDAKLEVIYDCFNMNDPVVGVGEKGRALRRAISLAIDQDWARHHLYNDRVARVDGPILEEFPEFDPTFRNPWKKRPDETRAQVLARARQVLADAGIDPAQVPPIEQDVQESSTDRQFFLATQRDLADLGLRLKPITATFQEMLTRVDKGQAQTWGSAWGADYPEAQNFLQLFYGPNKAPGPNGSNYANPVFDRLYEEAAVMQPSPERTKRYQEMQRIVVDDCVWVVKYRHLQYTLVAPWLYGYRYNDISPKSFKYLRVDDAARRADVVVQNVASPWPTRGFLAAVAAFVVALVVVARRTRRGW